MIQTNKSLYLLYGLFCSQSSSGIVSADIVIGPRELLEAKTLRFWVPFLLTLLWSIFAGRATSGLLTAALQQCSDSRQTDAAVSAAVNSDAAEVNNCCLDTVWMNYEWSSKKMFWWWHDLKVLIVIERLLSWIDSVHYVESIRMHFALCEESIRLEIVIVSNYFRALNDFVGVKWILWWPLWSCDQEI